jgi:chitinase
MTLLIDNMTIGTDITEPFSIPWTPTLGPHTILMRSYVGLLSSDSVVDVTGIVLPEATLQTPPSGWTSPVGQPVLLAAVGTSDTGFVDSIEFYVDNVLVGTATKFPHVIIYVPTTTGTKTVKSRSIAGAFTGLFSPTTTLTVTAEPTVEPGGWGRQTS